MARFTKNNKRNPLERTSSQGLVLGCPICAAKLDLLDTRDGDQAYWCHHCQSGWRAGNLPEAAHRSKDSAIPEVQVQAVTPAVEAPVAPSARAKHSRTQPRASPIAPQAVTPKPVRVPRAAPRQPLAKAQPLVAEVIAPKRRAAPRVPASEPKAVAVKPAAPSKSAPPRRAASARVAEVAVSPRKTAATKKALNETQKKPLLETNSKSPRRPAQTLAPVSKPIKASHQPLEATAPRTATQKSLKKTLETTASTPQPKRTRRSAPEPVMSGKGSRKPIVPVLKPVPTKRQPLEAKAKPKVSAPRVTAQKPSKKTLEITAPVKAPRAKPSRREQPALETSKGARKAGQTAAPSPKAAIGKRQKLQTVAPKASASRAAPQRSLKKTLEIATPIKPSRRKKPIFETTVAPQKIRPRRLAPALDSTPKPRRAARVVAPVKPARAAPEQRKSRSVPVKQSRAQGPTAPLEPIAQSRRAARGAAQPSSAPVKSLKPAPAKPEPTRAARVAKQPAVAAPRSKPTRSSPMRPAPSNPVQFGLFDALPMKTAPRRNAK